MRKSKQNNYKKRWKKLGEWERSIVKAITIIILISVISILISQRGDWSSLISAFKLLIILLVIVISFFWLYTKYSKIYWKWGVVITSIYLLIFAISMMSAIMPEGEFNPFVIPMLLPFGFLLLYLRFPLLPELDLGNAFVLNVLGVILIVVIIRYVIDRAKKIK